MTIVNRRNAVLGWLTWSVGKRVVAKKAKGVMPSSSDGGSGKKTVKAVAVLVTAAGAVVFWKKVKRRDSTDHDSVASEEIGTASEEIDTPPE